jgi:hypothetical protein
MSSGIGSSTGLFDFLSQLQNQFPSAASTAGSSSSTVMTGNNSSFYGSAQDPIQRGYLGIQRGGPLRENKDDVRKAHRVIGGQFSNADIDGDKRLSTVEYAQWLAGADTNFDGVTTRGELYALTQNSPFRVTIPSGAVLEEGPTERDDAIDVGVIVNEMIRKYDVDEIGTPEDRGLDFDEFKMTMDRQNPPGRWG